LPQSLREACAVSFELTQGGIAARLGGHCHPINLLEGIDSRFEASSRSQFHGQPSCPWSALLSMVSPLAASNASTDLMASGSRADQASESSWASSQSNNCFNILSIPSDMTDVNSPALMRRI